MAEQSAAPLRRLLIGFLLIAAACLGGCGSRPRPLPKTYPVHGKVTYKDGTPLDNGVMRFHPEAEPSVTTAGTIQPDGTYRLATMRDNLRADGAVAGPNRVSVRCRKIMIEGVLVGTPTVYPAPYNVEPRDNEFNLTVERQKR